MWLSLSEQRRFPQPKLVLCKFISFIFSVRSYHLRVLISIFLRYVDCKPIVEVSFEKNSRVNCAGKTEEEKIQNSIFSFAVGIVQKGIPPRTKMCR